ncbi:family 78 glycoside hydrolase catalytic domain [Mucilaginibacter lappiensis]
MSYAQLQVETTRCENNQNPLGVSTANFHFGWELSAKDRSETQSAYQIGVSSSKAKLIANEFDVWNSGKIPGNNSIMIPYRGNKLKPATVYFWKVKVWDKKGLPSIWSEVDSFCTGLENTKDWQNAKWIGYEDLADSMRVVPGVHAPYANQMKGKCLQRPVSPLFRKDFKISKKVASAFAFISGLGHYELSINGEKVGKAFLAPGWTYYDKTCLYNVLDITSLVKQGTNSVGVMLGNGFYNINRERYFKLVDAFGMPKLLSRIKINYEDGTTEDLISNSSWKTASSPITFNSIYAGEDYDARMELPGWNKPGFDDKNWKNAELVKAPLCKLTSDLDHPVAIMDSFSVIKINEPKSMVFVYDFGQNASGIPEIKIKGHRGQTVKLIPSEILNKDNMANQVATGEPYYLSYTLKGDSIETWHPRFTYYGLRYIQVDGAKPAGHAGSSSLPEVVSLKFLHTRNSSPANGTFTCSNELFNRIYTLINWAIKSNLQSVVTDCPHREKLSWLEQNYLMGASIHYNFDNYGLYRKLVNDLIDAQTPEGFIPDIAPEFVKFQDGFLDSPEWGSAGVIMPWLLYSWYHDENVVQKAYPMMKKYVQYLQNKSDHQILSYGLGDWFDYGPGRPGEAQLTPKALTATAIYYYDVVLLGKMAAILNQKAEVVKYDLQAKEIKAAFNTKFFDKNNAVYSTGSQTAMAMPLSAGLVNTPYRSAVLKNLCDSIISHNYKLTAGDIGFHFLVDALDKGGKSEVIYKMNNRDDVPGYGYQLKKGATALTESWPALQEVSNNHLMLGHVMEWFYSGLAGIDQESNSVGFKTLRIRPQPVGDINSASGSFHSPYGWVKTSWKKDGGKFTLSVTIPVNVTANIYLPVVGSSKVYENEKLIKPDHINGAVMIKCGSGNYKFEVK